VFSYLVFSNINSRLKAKHSESTQNFIIKMSVEIERNLRKTRTGVVSSSAREKTITVKVERKIEHPMYGKFMKKTTKFQAHDEANTAGIGDTVLIMETRPLSKTKRWRLVQILEKAK
jgi:small subunit ribosomal protein S17